MITIYFKDGTFRKVSPVEGQMLVNSGVASYTPYATIEKTETVVAPIDVPVTTEKAPEENSLNQIAVPDDDEIRNTDAPRFGMDEWD